MSEPEPAEDDWDFYPCRVDGAPASIFLNLALEQRPWPPEADMLYTVTLHMLDAGEHGMGTSAEAGVIGPAEDALATSAASLGLVYVGRLRTKRIWQLMLYGPPGQLEALGELTQRSDELRSRRAETQERPDGDHEVFRDFLLPDAERRQWMQDRRLVDVLLSYGDRLEVPRRIEHWAYFPSHDARERFVLETARVGFREIEAADGEHDEPDEPNEHGEHDEHGEHAEHDSEREGEVNGCADGRGGAARFAAHVGRIDTVELAHIHGVVMQLHAMAQRHGGTYDGWETSIEAALDN